MEKDTFSCRLGNQMTTTWVDAQTSRCNAPGDTCIWSCKWCEKSAPHPTPLADKPSKCHTTSIINNTIGIHMKWCTPWNYVSKSASICWDLLPVMLTVITTFISPLSHKSQAAALSLNESHSSIWQHRSLYSLNGTVMSSFQWRFLYLPLIC